MPRRHETTAERVHVSALAAFALALTTGCLETPAVDHPNVVLILVDTLRADHLGCYGYERNTTPNLDALASDAVRYTRTFSHAPWTTPAVAALFTSQLPSTLGIRNIQSPLPADGTTLAEVLQKNGFETAAFVSHSFVSSKWGFARGFDSFDESNIRGHFEVTSTSISDAAIEWLDERTGRQTQPFFLFLHYFDPHFAYVEHAEFSFGRDASYTGPVHSGILPERFGDDPPALRPEDLREMVALYDAEIAATDRAIGRLLDRLRKLGLYDSTIVVLTADHGEEFLDHGQLDHTKTLYDELVRVPLIVRVPGAEPAVVDDAVALIDVYPTLTAQLGIEAPPALLGQPLPPLPNADTGAPPRRIFLETARLKDLRAIVEGDYKLILDRESGRVRLFDLAADPKERTDLSLREPERTARLRGLIERWPGAAPRTATPDVDLSEEERERLRALGYL
jgi:arylsulfatase